MERLEIPRPVSTSASSGSAAASPHTPTGVPLADAALATISIMRGSAGDHGSFNEARLAEFRSAAGGGGTESAYALRGVGLLGVRLVRPGIQCAHHHAAAAERCEHATISADLLRNRRHLGPAQEAELGPVQPHTLGARLECRRYVARGSDVCQQGDSVAIGRAVGTGEHIAVRPACRGSGLLIKMVSAAVPKASQTARSGDRPWSRTRRLAAVISSGSRAIAAVASSSSPTAPAAAIRLRNPFATSAAAPHPVRRVRRR